MNLPTRFVARLSNTALSVVVIDSLNGYLNAMPEERFLTIQLHELLTYLGQAGVATILIGAHQGLVGGPMVAPVDASYLADAVILLRYFEAKGEVRQAISVVKKRGGAHERHDSRIPHGSRWHPSRPAATRISRSADRGPHHRDEFHAAQGRNRIVTDDDPGSREQRVVILAPTNKDGAMTEAILVQAGVACICCATPEEVRQQLDAGAAALVLAEEVVFERRNDCITAWLDRQPQWSDLPILVIARQGADSAAVARSMDILGNVTVLERPTRVASLVSAVRSALRAPTSVPNPRSPGSAGARPGTAIAPGSHRRVI